MDNSLDHMVSAVAGNGEVVARAVTARNLVQVREGVICYVGRELTDYNISPRLILPTIFLVGYVLRFRLISA